MKIALDAQLTVGTATGIGEYVRGLADALRAQALDVIELREPRLDPWRFDRRLYWDQVLLPSRARRSGAAMLHCASGTVPLATRLPVVVTVHDVAWLRAQSHTRPYARYYFGRFAVARYRRAAAIAVDSAFSRDELLDAVDGIDPSRVHVVYPGVARDFCTLTRGASDGRTILVVGTVERRKNLEALVRVLPSLPHARIVSVGPSTPYRAFCETLARECGVAGRVEFRGYVTRAELLEWYAHAAVAAVPSHYEGFGYGVAQALCAGVPCVAAAAASLPEVAGGDVRLVAVDDVDAWREALAAALRGDDEVRAASVRARAIERFAWEKSAQDMARVYRRATA